ncbi:ubiquitin carboxyl-terminal hydrolase 17-like protein B isoform X2 [Salarias fasciatus]|uniref:Ubiquitin carboxyl-terminal hydrolase n=1 Tax=Salarias fasciatus TaxID=181472 RepID=A0A672GIF2_SALFA|nr:ubiquitin carboxyl-terminal hydrolase 17-like protein B isoform X2 [Salarias fasciatus]
MSQRQVTSPAHVSYHGLRNQGATCYLNSVLQALFMTKDFKEAVRTSENREDRIDPQLKDLFDGLEKVETSTSSLIRELGIDRVCEQRDAAEYFEKILLRTSDEASQIFHGGLDKRTSCSTCQQETNSDAPFWYLPLRIGKGDCSVEDGIEEFFKATELRGDNQMYCEGCDAKSDATIGYVMNRPPDVLVLLLKRFNFSYHYMAYTKNNQPVSIPDFLDKNITPLKGSTYELYAVVDHFGDLRSGHYNTKIRVEDDGEHRWFNFDDTSVTVLGENPFQGNTVKSQNAYLLFYRKQKTQTPEITSGSSPPDQADGGGRCEGADGSGETEEDAVEVRRDLDGKQGDELKATQQSEDKEGKVDGDEFKENREDEAGGEREPESDREVSGRRSSSDSLQKQEERSEPRKRRMDADKDEDEPAEAKKGKSVTDRSDGSAEQPSDEGSGKDFTPKPVSEEEDENRGNTAADTDGKISAGKVTSGEISTDDQRSKEDMQKEQSHGDLSVQSIQQEQEAGLSAATQEDEGIEADVKENDLEEKSSESGGSQTERQVSEETRRGSPDPQTGSPYLIGLLIEEIYGRDTGKIIKAVVVKEFKILRKNVCPDVTKPLKISQ